MLYPLSGEELDAGLWLRENLARAAYHMLKRGLSNRIRCRAQLLIAALAIPIWAQSPLSLRDAVAEALAAHPSLAASAQRIAVTQGFQTQAALRPNPRFFFQHENIRPYAPPPIHYFEETDTFAMQA